MDTKKAREEKSLAECAQLALDNSPDVAELTEKVRKGAHDGVERVGLWCQVGLKTTANDYRL